MPKFNDLTGKKYNKLTVLSFAYITKSKQKKWKCQCDCGNITYVQGNNIVSGAVKSCGCLKNKKAEIKISDSPLYNTWCKIRYRCLNPKDPAYKDYGARGITICKEWLSFINFEKWAFDNGYKENMTIDRIDNNKGYSPVNCRFVDKKTQANNRRSCRIISYKGETKNLREWCDVLELDYKFIHNRIYKLHWDFEKAVSTPCDKSKRNKKG